MCDMRNADRMFTGCDVISFSYSLWFRTADDYANEFLLHNEIEVIMMKKEMRVANEQFYNSGMSARFCDMQMSEYEIQNFAKFVYKPAKHNRVAMSILVILIFGIALVSLLLISTSILHYALCGVIAAGMICCLFFAVPSMTKENKPIVEMFEKPNEEAGLKHLVIVSSRLQPGRSPNEYGSSSYIQVDNGILLLNSFVPLETIKTYLEQFQKLDLFFYKMDENYRIGVIFVKPIN